MNRVNLDALIERADLAIGADVVQRNEQAPSISVDALQSTSNIVLNLRKPDFQRETNHWDPDQVVRFLESFVDYELVPSAILWQSPTFVFVIDGAHRISAVRAWIEDDYGDGVISQKFYRFQIPDAQKVVARDTRKLVQERVGDYKTYKDALQNRDKYSSQDKLLARASNMSSRSLALQWVTGDAAKAETSFFNINTLGTPLDDTEELILRNRARSIAIAARSIARSGTGHKYWSKFSDELKVEIEKVSGETHGILFHPEVTEQKVTFDLPIGGSALPVDGLAMLMRLISICHTGVDEKPRDVKEFQEDATGSGTLEVLKKTKNVLRWISGMDPASLGLHPGIYFYSHRARFNADLFLGFVYFVAIAVAKNQKSVFAEFSKGRAAIEEYIIANKALITLLLQSVRSAARVQAVRQVLQYLIQECAIGRSPTEEGLIRAMGLQGRIVQGAQAKTSPKVTKETKAVVRLRTAIEGAPKCPICSGRIDAKSVSYDHIKRVEDGGTGDADNVQASHFYCNHSVKN
jgi:hypothetical protein